MSFCYLSAASEMTYIVSSGALNSTHSLLFRCICSAITAIRPVISEINGASK